MSNASNLAGFVTSISPVNNLTVGVVTASSFVGDLTGNVTGNVNAGVVTASSFDGSFSGNLTGDIYAGIVTATSSATLGNVEISSGIVTAVSGVVTYYGDGSNLNLTGNTTAGVSEGKVFFISARR